MNPLTSKARRRRRRSLALSASLALAQADDCPPMLNGWIPTPGCHKYYLCEDGKKASPDYDCREGFLFDVTTTNCQQAGGVICKAFAGEPDATGEGKNKAQAPPACGGVPEHFFVDVPTQSCPSSCQKTKPEWVSAIFPTREECCQTNFAWMPLDDCLGQEVGADERPDMWTLAPTIQGDVPAPVPESISSPTAPPVKFSPDDPEFYFMCGVDWGDASARCHQRCAGGSDDECPEGEGCFSETSCNGVDTAAPTEPRTSRSPSPRPTRRTRKPNTEGPTKSPSTMETMSAVHSINVVEAFQDEKHQDDDQDEGNEPTSLPTMSSSSSSPTYEPTKATPATRKPRPEDTPSPTEAITSAPVEPTSAPQGFPTFAPSSSPSQRPNFVVTMIANPETSDIIQTMSESLQDSPFNPIYGFGMVPNLGGPNQQVSQGSQGSGYLNLYGQESAQTVPATEAPSQSFEDVFFGPSSVSVSEMIIPVSADATVSPKRPDLNFGLNSMLALDGGDAFEQFDILLKFDVSVIDDASTIKGAKLMIYAADDCPSGGSYYSTTSFNSDWDASEITWNTAPKSLALLDSLDSVAAEQWYSVDIMRLFKLRFETYVTIRVELRTTGRCMFASMEHKSTNAPYIELKIEQSESQIVSMSGSLNNDPPAPLQMDLLPIQSGDFGMVRASADATIDAIRVDDKLGASPSLHISLSISPRHIIESLIRFDLLEFQQQKPASAMLVLFPEINCHSAGRIAVTGSNQKWSESDMNWSNAPATELVIGTFGTIEAGHWYGFNVLKALEWAHVRMMDSITFRLSSDGDYSCQYSSIQSGRAPKLVASF